MRWDSKSDLQPTYDGGLTRFKGGKFSQITTDAGLYNDGVFHILEDDRGWFWITSNRGIYRVQKGELNDYADGKRASVTSIGYGKSDGMLNVECNGGRWPAGQRVRDGRLWFPTQDGIAVIDPKEVKINAQPPPVAIESVRIGDRSLDRSTLESAVNGSNNEIQLEPHEQNFEVQYTALSFVNSENLRFRYRLDGLDPQWINAGTRRTAYFSYVPHGQYRFQVIAANADGVWNEVGKSITIVVLPPFYRTWWFAGLAALILGVTAYLLYRYQVTQNTRRHKLEMAFSRKLVDSQELERKRFAAEMHDGLGQSFVIIKNRARLSQKQLGDEAVMMDDLPFTILTADFNNDGKADIATGNGSGTVSILLGNGAGGFTPAQGYSSTGYIRSMDVGDFNGDGKLDIVNGIRSSSNLEILKGDGNGGFSLYQAFPYITVSPAVVVGDFNGDRRADIAVSNNDDEAMLLLGNAEAGFNTISLSNPYITWGIAAIDINSDGHSDLVGTHTNLGGGNYYVGTAINTCNVVSRYESDVAGRPWGDGAMQTDDVTQVRRFVTKASLPDISDGEFQRADSAPKDTGGDGSLDARDVVQARRYAAESDEIKPSTGPTELTSISSSAAGEKDNLRGSTSQLTIQSVNAVAGRPVTINVRADAIGRESEYEFSVRYDPSIFVDPTVAPGSAGAAICECYVYPIGQLNCSVGEFTNSDSSGSDANIGEIALGQDHQLVTITLQVASTAPGGFTTLSLQNLNAANDAAEAIALSGIDGSVQILVPTAANVSISGKVLDRNGFGIARAVVTVTGKSGTNYQAVTNTFGYFVIDNVPAGSGYVLSTRSKREAFSSQIVDINDNVTGIVIQPSP